MRWIYRGVLPGVVSDRRREEPEQRRTGAAKMILALLLFIAAPVHAEPIDATTLERVLVIADAQGVPRPIALQLMVEESGNWRTGAFGDARAWSKVASKGYYSRGLYQLWEEPSNLAYLLECFWTGDEFDIENPIHNATVGLGYIASLYERFGSWYLAACAYNWGPGNVASRRKPPKLTREYATRIAAD